jgi:phosphate-selective porin OprO and OprP
MNFNKKLATAVSGAVLLMAGHIALADSTTDIVDALVSKGVLTEEEGKLISKGAKTQKDAQPVIKEKDGAFSISSPNGKNSVQLTGRMHFDYRNSNINQFDNGLGTYAFSNDSDSKSVGDHFAMRRARIGIKGRIGGMADYLLLANIQGSDILDEGYLDINKFEPLGLKFGKFKQPMNLEIMTSSNNIDEIERSYVSQNTPEKKFGVGLHGEIKGITYFGSMFNNNDAAQSQKDDSMSYAGRGTVNFAELMDNKDLVAHFGVNGYTSQYEITPTVTGNTSGSAEATTRGTVFSYTSGGAGLANMLRAQIGGERMLGTSGTCLDTLCAGYNYPSPSTSTVKTRKGGLEGIVAYKNFKVQGEYASQNWKSSTANLSTENLDADVNTWYVEALWTLTGEKYADQYKKGAFGLAKPSSEVNLDSLNIWSNPGLWEASLRVDAVDLNGGTVDSAGDYSRVQGSVVKGTDIDSCKGNATNGCKSALSGGAKSTTLGIKWVLTPNLLFKANYTYTSFDQAFAPIDIGTKTSARTDANMKLIDHEDLFMLRGQYMF